MSGGGLPEYQRQVTSRPVGVVSMPSSAGSMAGLSKAMDQLEALSTGVATDLGRRERERSIFQAEEDARIAPLRDEAGNYTVPDQRDPLTREGRTFNAGITKRLADDTALRGAEQAVALRQQADQDPARFAALWKGYADGILNSIRPDLREATGQVLGRLGVEHLSGISTDAGRTERRLQAATWGARREQLNNDLLGLAANGVTSGPAYERALGSYNAHINDGITTRQIDAGSAALLRERIADDTMGAVVVRSAQDAVRTGGTRDDVLRGFDETMDRLALPAPQRARLRNYVEAAANEAEAVRREGRTQVTADAEDWQTRMEGGVPVPPDEGRRLAQAARDSGAPRLAQRIEELAAVQDDARSMQALSTPDLARQAQRLASRVAQPDATARDVKVSEVASRMVARRREAFAADPLAAGAAVHAGAIGGGLAPLDLANPDAAMTGLQRRATQAAQIASREGLPPSQVPALTKPEMAGLTSMIQTGSQDVQAGLLRALAGGLPGGQLGRVMGQLDQNDHRVRAFTAAAGIAQTNMGVATDILSGMEVLRQTPAPSLSTPRFGQVMEEELRQALALNPRAFAQASEAAKALYAQRAVVRPDGSKPDLSGALDDERLRGIIKELVPTVTMGAGWFASGTRIPTPRPGMTQVQFDEHMAAMPAEALSGARAQDGRAFTPDMLRRGGQLMATGPGRYRVRYGGFDVLGANGDPFEMDLSGPWPQRTSDSGFRASLAAAEGGRAGLGAQNAEGYVGRYQVGTARLAELGLYQPAEGESVSSNQWRGMVTVPGMAPMTLAEFKRSERAQEAVADAHFAAIDSAIDEGGLIGRPVPGGTATRDGLRAVAHLGGTAGMRRFVSSGGTYDPADSNGTHLSDYHRRFSRTG